MQNKTHIYITGEICFLWRGRMKGEEEKKEKRRSWIYTLLFTESFFKKPNPAPPPQSVGRKIVVGKMVAV